MNFSVHFGHCLLMNAKRGNDYLLFYSHRNVQSILLLITTTGVQSDADAAMQKRKREAVSSTTAIIHM